MGFPLLDIVGIGAKLIDKLIPDQGAKAAALLKLKEMEQAGELAQMNADLQVIAGQNKINELEASNSRLFVSGWRPSVGWICSASLAFQLVLGPIIVWGSDLTGHPVRPPVMQTELLTTLLVGMLGLGGMRTVEKLSGVASK